jgi:hypothetical protein
LGGDSGTCGVANSVSIVKDDGISLSARPQGKGAQQGDVAGREPEGSVFHGVFHGVF